MIGPLLPGVHRAAIAPGAEGAAHMVPQSYVWAGFGPAVDSMRKPRRRAFGLEALAFAIAFSVLGGSMVGAAFKEPPSIVGTHLRIATGSAPGEVIENLNFSVLGITGTAFDSQNGNVYVLGQLNVPGPWGGVVSILSGSELAKVATLQVHQYPEGPVVDSNNGQVYVSSSASSPQIVAIDPTNDLIVANLTSLPEYPEAPIVDTTTGNLFFAWDTFPSYGVDVLSGTTDQVVGNDPLSSFPTAGTFDSQNGEIYFSAVDPNSLIAISGATDAVTATVSLEGPPSAPIYDPMNGEIYVTISSMDEVLAFSGSTAALLHGIPVGDQAASPVLDPANGDLYVSNGGSNNVSVISGSNDTLVGTISSVPAPHGILYDPLNQNLYVASWSGGDLCVISPAGVTEGFIPVGEDPDPPVLDGVTGNLLVSDMISGGTQNALSVVHVNNSGLMPATCEPPSPGTGLGAAGLWYLFVAFGSVIGALILLVSVFELARRRKRRGIKFEDGPPNAG